MLYTSNSRGRNQLARTRKLQFHESRVSAPRLHFASRRVSVNIARSPVHARAPSSIFIKGFERARYENMRYGMTAPRARARAGLFCTAYCVSRYFCIPAFSYFYNVFLYLCIYINNIFFSHRERDIAIRCVLSYSLADAVNYRQIKPARVTHSIILSRFIQNGLSYNQYSAVFPYHSSLYSI